MAGLPLHRIRAHKAYEISPMLITLVVEHNLSGRLGGTITYLREAGVLPFFIHKGDWKDFFTAG